MFLESLGRVPDSDETAALLAYLAQAEATYASLPDGTPRARADADALAWGDVAHTILCLKEFIYVE